jgi:hypothetical protein
MSEVQSQVTALAADLQRVLARLITVMRRGDTAAGSRPDLDAHHDRRHPPARETRSGQTFP